MLPKNYYRQRGRNTERYKAKRYEEKLNFNPLRLVGGMDGAMVEAAPNLRDILYDEWEALSDPTAAHMYTEDVVNRINPRYFADITDRILLWQPVTEVDPAEYPWPATMESTHLYNHGVLVEQDDGPFMANDLVPHPGQPEQSHFRLNEIQELQLRGDFWAAATGAPIPAGGGAEARWAFLGLSDRLGAFGPAWTCFYYGLSDIYIGGHTSGSDICVSVMQIAEDIMNIVNRNGRDFSDNLAYFFLEGLTDPDRGARQMVFITGGGHTLNSISQDPTPLLEVMLRVFTSDADFLFYRVYVHLMTNLVAGAGGLVAAGGSLRMMPRYMLALRKGPLYNDVKGYKLIDDDEDDCACALDAIVWAMANCFTRITKTYNKVKKAVPEVCTKFKKFRYRLANKGLASAKLVAKAMKEELASYINWQRGTHITHKQICTMVSRFSERNNVELGVLIFDAVQPLRHDIVSNYYPVRQGQKEPEEVICLVHWAYPSPTMEEEESFGHYDCIDSKNITTWLTKPAGVTNRKRFSFRNLVLQYRESPDDKGKWCLRCKHWQKSTSDAEWGRDHGDDQKSNDYGCLDCGVFFKSEHCKDMHTKKPPCGGSDTASACATLRLCPTCGKVHKISADCTTFWCPVCYDRFPIEERKKKTHVCYLQPISEKKGARVSKVLYSDMEAGRPNGFHAPVSIATTWTEICANHQKLRNLTKNEDGEKKKKCQDCLLNTDNWGWFCDGCLRENELELSNECDACSLRHHKYFVGTECLKEYMDWVMTEHPGATVLFHNGGKYDLQLLMVEMLTTGKYYKVSDAMRGTQIIYFSCAPISGAGEKKKRQQQVHFKDSLNFITTSLRSFPAMFKLVNQDKGRFPYDLLNTTGWEDWDDQCPEWFYFGITQKEFTNHDKLSKIRAQEIKDIIEYIESENKKCEESKGEYRWNAMDKLKHYNIQDTIVLHDGFEEFRLQFWNLVGVDPLQWVTLPSAVAGAFRQPKYMKLKSLQIFNIDDREWQREAMRGGRCEVFKLYWKKTKDSEHFRWVDVNSEYPAVQAYGYYPVGALTVDLKYLQFTPYRTVAISFFRKTGVRLDAVLFDRTGANGCGIMEFDFRSACDVSFPVLPARTKVAGGYTKNLFYNHSGRGTFYITIVAEAVSRGQIIITAIKRIQYWKNTSNKLFRNFMCNLYSAKVEASGWEKILNKKLCVITEEEKKEYLEESAKRGVHIDELKVEDNPGKRNTAKIANNCGWGYLSKKATANENHFFDNYDVKQVDEMEDLLMNLESDKDPRRMIGSPSGIGKYTRVRTDKKAKDITVQEMDKKVAYAVGGQVPAYGLQKLSSGLLSLDPSQPAYCDTDSIAYVFDSENKRHNEIPTGPYLGDWVDEYPEWDIVEFVSTGCKSYYVKMVHLHDKEKIIYKGRFKGIPFNSGSFSLLDKKGEIASFGMEEMKNLVFTAMEAEKKKNQDVEDMGFEPDTVINELTYEFKYTNFFKRNPDYKIKAVQEKKTVRFTYDKRQVVSPYIYVGWRKYISEINTLPLNDLTSPHVTRKKVAEFWKKERESSYQ